MIPNPSLLLATITVNDKTLVKLLSFDAYVCTYVSTYVRAFVAARNYFVCFYLPTRTYIYFYSMGIHLSMKQHVSMMIK